VLSLLLPEEVVMPSWVFQEGVKKGEAKSKAEDIRELLAAYGLAVSDAECQKILGETDLPTLERWFKCAIGAKAAAEIFLSRGPAIAALRDLFTSSAALHRLHNAIRIASGRAA
jgi:hypothetical protein